MVRKPVYSVIFFAILIVLLFYIENKYGLFYSIACGTGINGLKVIGIILIVVLFIILFDRRKNRSKKIYCKGCLSQLEDEWKICPYCGLERAGDD
jgi:amino acid transporter